LLLLAGCGAPHDTITTYVVSKTDRAKANRPENGPRTNPPRTNGPRDRLLAAIVPHGKRAWFFKLVGPQQRVDHYVAEFEALIRSVKFRGGEEAPPKWVVPAGWHERPGSGMRFATLRVDAEDPPLELTVIPLPMDATDPEQVILSNVNRWRGQMDLQPLRPDQLSHETKQIPLDGTKATLVNLVGHHRRTMPGR